jgi:excisionase family DNA binding protein
MKSAPATGRWASTDKKKTTSKRSRPATSKPLQIGDGAMNSQAEAKLRTAREPGRESTTAWGISGSVARGQPIGKLRTIPYTAEPLETSERTIQRLIACGKLRTHRIGRLVRIADADIAALLDAAWTF